MKNRKFSSKFSFTIWLIFMLLMTTAFISSVIWTIMSKHFLGGSILTVIAALWVILGLCFGRTIRIIEFHKDKVLFIPLLLKKKTICVLLEELEMIRIVQEIANSFGGIKHTKFYEFIFPRKKKHWMDPFRLESTPQNDRIIREHFEGRVLFVEDSMPPHLRTYPFKKGR